ncbi:MAG: polymerase sigma-70 factor [Marmoricola sp.]|nr:polymerase sigma-70 factor [Marmoricola sp.]
MDQAPDDHRGDPEDSRVDAVSAAWVNGLRGTVVEREDSIARLHALLLRVAHVEAARRAGVNGIIGPELEDLAHQAATDACLSIVRKVEDFRGDSKFTTWAYKFVIYEVSTKFSRHAWRRHDVTLDDAGWERLPGRLGTDPEDVVGSRELVLAVRRAVEEELTPHQRRVFVAIVLDATPLDVLAAELESNRNAIYKSLFDARRKLRAHLVTHGYITDKTTARTAPGKGAET